MERIVRRTPLLVFGIAVVATVILAACSGGGPGATSSPTPAMVSTATPTVAATPTATPTPAPVLSPCEAVPDLPTTVSDQPNLYSISVPDGWVKNMDEGASDTRISSIYVESPDFSTFRDVEAEALEDLAYFDYETGAGFGILVMTSSSYRTYHDDPVISESNVAIDGVNASYHVFVEPSIRVGQLLDAHADNGGNDYLFYFGYNPETCPAGEDLFQAMLDSFQFN